MNSDSKKKLKYIRETTTGIKTSYTLATGHRTRRVYLDNAATTLQILPSKKAQDTLLQHIANTHSNIHFSAMICTHYMSWAHNSVLYFFGASPTTHTAIFIGNGATAGINGIARQLQQYAPKKDLVLVSLMEHHSNDLPHRKYAKHVIHLPLVDHPDGLGEIDVKALEDLLKENQKKIRYIAITGASNVTGIINPIKKISNIAKKYQVKLIVDGSQMVAHMPISLSSDNIDVLIFSGHKAYAPSSPGVIIIKKSLLDKLEPDQFGGGMVEDVTLENFIKIKNQTEQHEAGTQNVIGAVSLAASLSALKEIGMKCILKHEKMLTSWVLKSLQEIAQVIIYGSVKNASRIGVISFNIENMHHQLTASILNDYFGIAVRNDCFCAHPYVRQMISNQLEEELDHKSNEEIEALAELHRGMVRVSFGIYNNIADCQKLIRAINKIVAHQNEYKRYYRYQNGNYYHKDFDNKKNIPKIEFLFPYK